jgi:hypothetical protein
MAMVDLYLLYPCYINLALFQWDQQYMTFSTIALVICERFCIVLDITMNNNETLNWFFYLNNNSCKLFNQT